MKNLIDLSHTEVVLAFAASCIESTARHLGKSYQEIILSNRIGIIAAELSKRLDISPAKALQLIYESKTCTDLHDKETGLYLFGNLYIVDEVLLELRG